MSVTSTSFSSLSPILIYSLSVFLNEKEQAMMCVAARKFKEIGDQKWLLVSTPDLVFCPPPPGKPDPRAPIDPQLRKPRRRVVQAPQKEDTCWYYAIQLIRFKIGKNPPPSLKGARAEEQLASSFRKTMTRIDRFWSSKIGFTEDIMEKMGIDSFTKIHASQFLSHTGKMNALKREMVPFLQTFCKQDRYKDLYSFAKMSYEDALIEAREGFLKRSGASHKEFCAQFSSIAAQFSQENTVLFQMSTTQERALLGTHCTQVIARKLGLKVSPWHPTQSIEQLATQLRRKGPHVVGGHFGLDYYEKLPFKLAEQVAGRSVWGWKPATKRRNEGPRYHDVVVVGAHLGQKRVYYIDPRDGSNPADIEQQKIYTVSYAKFTSYLCDLSGSQLRSLDGEREFLPSSRYALYGNPAMNYL